MIIDLPLVGLAVMFFCLSFFMQWILYYKLPIEYQPAWSFVSIWGIFCVVTSCFILNQFIRQETSLLAFYWDMWIVFLASTPGMLLLNWKQWKRDEKPQFSRLAEIERLLNISIDNQAYNAERLRNILQPERERGKGQ